LLQEKAAQGNEGAVALAATLRNIDAEIRDVRAQIGAATANILENEHKINSLISL
jgi:hypothetical protein